MGGISGKRKEEERESRLGGHTRGCRASRVCRRRGNMWHVVECRLIKTG